MKRHHLAKGIITGDNDKNERIGRRQKSMKNVKEDYDDYDLDLDEAEEDEEEFDEEEDKPKRKRKLKEPWDTILSVVACVILLHTLVTQILPEVCAIGGVFISSAICLYYFIVLCIRGLIWGFVAHFIAKSKGYDNGFFWGFFLGLIGLIVVCARPAINKEDEEYNESQIRKNSIESLQKLTDLYDNGMITEEEYKSKKKRLLDKI